MYYVGITVLRYVEIQVDNIALFHKNYMLPYKSFVVYMTSYEACDLFDQVGSRRVAQTTGIILILVGLFGKFGALFVTLPSPIMGGVYMVMFGQYIIL